MPQTTIAGHRWYLKVASKLNIIFGTETNPFYVAGQLAFANFLIATLSGIYLFIFFQIDPKAAYQSVQNISSTFLGSLMRSIHRFSSDAFIITSFIHFLHTLLLRKYHLKLSWISGILMIFIMGLIGLSGFILVWDAKAKLLGLLSATLLTTLPIFEPTLPIAFVLKDPHLLGGFFRVMLFAHLFFSLGVLILFWLHVMRLSNVRLLPPRKLLIGLLATFTALSILFPVQSDPPATEIFLPTDTTWDWYYFAGYQLLRFFSPPIVWIIWTISGLILFLLPFLPRTHHMHATLPIPTLDDERCDGCRQCYLDCPYNAISMRSPYYTTSSVQQRHTIAMIDPELCVRCGICIGSCHQHALSLPMFSPLPPTTTTTDPVWLIYACHCSLNTRELQQLQQYGIVYPLSCIGALHPDVVHTQWQHNNYHGILLLYCERCYYRLGPLWTQLRFSRYRRPMLPKTLDSQVVTMLPTTGAIEQWMKTMSNKNTSTNELDP